jgi:hypothetical protein
MRADTEQRDQSEPAIAELGAITDLTKGKFMPLAWESPVIKDFYEP